MPRLTSPTAITGVGPASARPNATKIKMVLRVSSEQFVNDELDGLTAADAIDGA